MKWKKNVAPGTADRQTAWSAAAKICGLVAVFTVAFTVFKSGSIRGEASSNPLVIDKSKVTSIARFYPYNAGGTKLEVIAVRASDGTVRTAFNTCQVCFDSGRGFYTQQGDELVCNNCGNRFKVDQIEKIKYGCNPIPILKENKKDNGKTITIAGDFLAKNAKYFARWKKN